MASPRRAEPSPARGNRRAGSQSGENAATWMSPREPVSAGESKPPAIRGIIARLTPRRKRLLRHEHGDASATLVLVFTFGLGCFAQKPFPELALLIWRHLAQHPFQNLEHPLDSDHLYQGLEIHELCPDFVVL